MNLDEIEPLAALGIHWIGGNAQANRFCIPLKGNRNDKGTLFAGSQYSALVIAGWYHTSQWAHREDLSEQVAIKDSHVSYSRAARSDLIVEARFQSPPDLRLSGHWRARVEVIARDDDSDIVATLTGDYRVLMSADS
jgi:hypothetical protein